MSAKLQVWALFRRMFSSCMFVVCYIYCLEKSHIYNTFFIKSSVYSHPSTPSYIPLPLLPSNFMYSFCFLETGFYYITGSGLIIQTRLAAHQGPYCQVKHSSSPGSHHLPRAPAMGGALWAPPLLMLGFWLAWSYVDLVHAATATVVGAAILRKHCFAAGLPNLWLLQLLCHLFHNDASHKNYHL